MDFIDKLAEQSVRDAIAGLTAGGKRPCSKNVPAEACKLLLKRLRGRTSEAKAEQRVLDASWRLKERREIIAPTSPHVEWEIVDRSPPSAAKSEGA